MKQTTKFFLGAVAVVAMSAGVAGVTSYAFMQQPEQNNVQEFADIFQPNPNTQLAALNAVNAQPVDLTMAAENSVNAVVHIKSTQESKKQTVTVRDPFYEFFGDMFGNRGGQQRQIETPEKVGFGSGVIISKDGYIVTNNHVIENADIIKERFLENKIVLFDTNIVKKNGMFTYVFYIEVPYDLNEEEFLRSIPYDCGLKSEL